MSFRINQVFQAKVKDGEKEKNVQLVSINSNFSYNLENETRQLSNMITTFNSSALPIISSLTGSMSHTFYNLTDSTQQFWSPQLLSFTLRTSFRIAGNKFFFDDINELPKGKESKSDLTPDYQTGSSWSFTADYNYSESGVKDNWKRSSFVSFNLSFKLTPSTTIRYSQRYDISKNLTINNSININRKIHCWTGSLYWVPKGTNRGFGFKLFVTQLPEIKLDNNYNTFTTQTFNR